MSADHEFTGSRCYCAHCMGQTETGQGGDAPDALHGWAAMRLGQLDGWTPEISCSRGTFALPTASFILRRRVRAGLSAAAPGGAEGPDSSPHFR